MDNWVIKVRQKQVDEKRHMLNAKIIKNQGEELNMKPSGTL